MALEYTSSVRGSNRYLNRSLLSFIKVITVHKPSLLFFSLSFRGEQTKMDHRKRIAEEYMVTECIKKRKHTRDYYKLIVAGRRGRRGGGQRSTNQSSNKHAHASRFPPVPPCLSRHDAHRVSFATSTTSSLKTARSTAGSGCRARTAAPTAPTTLSAACVTDESAALFSSVC